MWLASAQIDHLLTVAMICCNHKRSSGLTAGLKQHSESFIDRLHGSDCRIEHAGVTGLVLTKLDGSAKGGIAVAIAYELGLPVKLIGVGEGLDDLRPFDPHDFARALVAP